jgi:preprotein translocase subunit SecD
VLWQFGSGAIQNFATTLLIGVISSLVTGVYFTRVLFDLYILKDRDTLAV